MNGFTEDLLNCVARDIEQNWERTDGNVAYFADRVRKSGLTTEDLSNYLAERGKVCPVCVTTVFNYIVEPFKRYQTPKDAKSAIYVPGKKGGDA